MTDLALARRREEQRAAWRATGVYPALTIDAALARGAAQHPDARLVFAPVERASTITTLAELWARAGTHARRLASVGVRPGDAVVVQATTDRDGTEALIALWRLGAVVVPVVVTATAADLALVVRETGAAVVITVDRWRDRTIASDLASQTSAVGLRTVVVLGDDAPDGAVALDHLPAHADPPPPPADPSAVACVLYTSGSTAAPKGVRHSHETLLAGLMEPAGTTTTALATFPSGHVAALLSLLRPLIAGGTTVVMDRWSARAAAALVEQHRVTVSAGTPFFLATLLDEAERSGRDLSSLGAFLVGAAPVPPALVERAEAAGITTWRTYGSTEHPAIAAGSPQDPPVKRRQTDGRIGPANEVRIVGPSGDDLPSGEEGEILARGPRQFLGYQDSSLDSDAFVDGTWYRTGDLGLLDEDGFLVVTDRVKDIVIRGGENISAREVEEALALHPAVGDVAVTAAPDEVWGEAVAAVVVLRHEATAPTLADLRAHCAAEGLAPHKLPERLAVQDDLPRTAAGKVRKRDLRSIWSPQR